MPAVLVMLGLPGIWPTTGRKGVTLEILDCSTPCCCAACRVADAATVVRAVMALLAMQLGMYEWSWGDVAVFSAQACATPTAKFLRIHGERSRKAKAKGR